MPSPSITVNLPQSELIYSPAFAADFSNLTRALHTHFFHALHAGLGRLHSFVTGPTAAVFPAEPTSQLLPPDLLRAWRLHVDSFRTAGPTAPADLLVDRTRSRTRKNLLSLSQLCSTILSLLPTTAGPAAATASSSPSSSLPSQLAPPTGLFQLIRRLTGDDEQQREAAAAVHADAATAHAVAGLVAPCLDAFDQLDRIDGIGMHAHCVFTGARARPGAAERQYGFLVRADERDGSSSASTTATAGTNSTALFDRLMRLLIAAILAHRAAVLAALSSARTQLGANDTPLAAALDAVSADDMFGPGAVSTAVPAGLLSSSPAGARLADAPVAQALDQIRRDHRRRHCDGGVGRVAAVLHRSLEPENSAWPLFRQLVDCWEANYRSMAASEGASFSRIPVMQHLTEKRLDRLWADEAGRFSPQPLQFLGGAACGEDGCS